MPLPLIECICPPAGAKQMILTRALRSVADTTSRDTLPDETIGSEAATAMGAATGAVEVAVGCLVGFLVTFGAVGVVADFFSAVVVAVVVAVDVACSEREGIAICGAVIFGTMATVDVALLGTLGTFSGNRVKSLASMTAHIPISSIDAVPIAVSR
jgi:hypothetical protein